MIFKLIIILPIVVLIPSLLILLNLLTQAKMKFSLEKNSPFECGFNSFNTARTPFSNQFFIISIIFLIFDIEIVLILPFIPVQMSTPNFIWSSLFIFLLIILTASLIMEWYDQKLSWIC